MVNHVHFILSGKCRLIEHMLVREYPSYYGMQYELYDSETFGPQQQPRRKIAEHDKLELNQLDKSIPVRIKKNFILLYTISLILVKCSLCNFFSLCLCLFRCTNDLRTRIVFNF